MKFFKIALLEELNEKKVSPVLAEVPRLGRIRYIGQVEHYLSELVLELDIAHIKFLGKHVSTQLTNRSEMMRHVSSEDRAYHLLPYFLVCLSIELAYPIDFLGRGKQFKTGCYVMVLKNTLVIVSNSSTILDLREEDIIDAGMFEVVAACSYEIGHQFDVIELTK